MLLIEVEGLTEPVAHWRFSLQKSCTVDHFPILTMPTKDGHEDQAKIINESSRIFISLCFDKLEEVTCDLFYGYSEKNKENVE